MTVLAQTDPGPPRRYREIQSDPAPGANWDSVVYIDGVLELRTQTRGATTKQGLELHVLDGQKRLGRRRSGDSFDSKPDNLLVLGDHLGSANVELDWSLGSFVDREEFRPYGETSFGSYANKRYRFTGKERDEEIGLNYHGARYYAPGLARWMSPDRKEKKIDIHYWTKKTFFILFPCLALMSI